MIVWDIIPSEVVARKEITWGVVCEDDGIFYGGEGTCRDMCHRDCGETGQERKEIRESKRMGGRLTPASATPFCRARQPLQGARQCRRPLPSVTQGREAPQ